MISENPSIIKYKSGCIILASGNSKRFGSNKLLATIQDKPLICWVIDATRDLFDNQVVVTRYLEVASICKQHGIKCILHDMPFKNDTIRLGINSLEQDVDYCMFLQADQPLIRRDTILSMIASYQTSDLQILRARYANQVASPVIFPQSLFEELATLPHEKGGSEVIRSHPDMINYYEVKYPYELMDADTPQDLEMLSRYITSI